MAGGARERILDREAIGPQQFTVSQRTFLDHLAHAGREDPTPADWHMATVTQDDSGGCEYEDTYADNDDGWALPGLGVPPTMGALLP
jgi:hypothetical protein